MSATAPADSAEKAAVPAAPAAPEKAASDAEAPAPVKAADALAAVIPDAAPAAAPAEYKLTAPDGFDEKYVADIVEFAKANDVSPKAAQALLDRQANALKAYHEGETAKAQGWLDTIRKEHSNERLIELRKSIGLYLDKNLPADVVKLLTEGAAPPILMPGVFGYFAKQAEAGREGAIVKAGEPTKPAQQTARERFAKTYADMTPAQRVAAGFE